MADLQGGRDGDQVLQVGVVVQCEVGVEECHAEQRGPLMRAVPARSWVSARRASSLSNCCCQVMSWASVGRCRGHGVPPKMGQGVGWGQGMSVSAGVVDIGHGEAVQALDFFVDRVQI